MCFARRGTQIYTDAFEMSNSSLCASVDDVELFNRMKSSKKFSKVGKLFGRLVFIVHRKTWFEKGVVVIVDIV